MKTGKKKFSFTLDRKSLAKRKKKYRLWKRFLATKDAKVYEEYCKCRITKQRYTKSKCRITKQWYTKSKCRITKQRYTKSKCRNQVRRITRNAIKKQEQEIAKKAKYNSKVFWKFINSKTKFRSSIPNLYTTKKPDADKMTTDDHQKANILGEYFSSVFVKEHPRVFKEIASVLVNLLFMIFNLTIKHSKIPSAWKLASITAIYKNKGSKHSAENYRPISLTSIACKIMESFIRDSMLNYLKANDILSNEQFGFLRGRSTVLQLLKVVDKWTEIMDKGGVIDVIYCDFQKALDTVPHKRLLEILIHYGITDPVISWVQDFLSNRRQHILVNGCKSEIFEVISGVPQGSVLGPLLFIIYINSMIDKTGSLDLFLYADDLKIYNEINTDEDVEALQQDLDRLYDWTQYSLLKFHPGKCVAMCLKSKSKNNEPNCFYNMDQTKLKKRKYRK